MIAVRAGYSQLLCACGIDISIGASCCYSDAFGSLYTLTREERRGGGSITGSRGAEAADENGALTLLCFFYVSGVARVHK